MTKNGAIARYCGQNERVRLNRPGRTRVPPRGAAGSAAGFVCADTTGQFTPCRCAICFAWLTASFQAASELFPEVSRLVRAERYGAETAASAGASYCCGIFSACGPKTSMVTWPPKNLSPEVRAGNL